MLRLSPWSKRSQPHPKLSLFASFHKLQTKAFFSVKQEFKMIVMVRKDLKMSTGKIAAQVAHAAVGLYKKMVAQQLVYSLEAWQKEGEPTIVVSVPDDKEMGLLELKAKDSGLITCAIRDAGRTQVIPGSRTVCAVLGKASDVDKITSHLKLL